MVKHSKISKRIEMILLKQKGPDFWTLGYRKYRKGQTYECLKLNWCKLSPQCPPIRPLLLLSNLRPWSLMRDSTDINYNKSLSRKHFSFRWKGAPFQRKCFDNCHMRTIYRLVMFVRTIISLKRNYHYYWRLLSARLVSPQKYHIAPPQHRDQWSGIRKNKMKNLTERTAFLKPNAMGEMQFKVRRLCNCAENTWGYLHIIFDFTLLEYLKINPNLKIGGIHCLRNLVRQE